MPAEEKVFTTMYGSDAYTEKLKVWVPVRETKAGFAGRAEAQKITGWL